MDFKILIILFLILFKNIKTSENEKRLQEDIIRGYNRLVRPVEKNTDQLQLKLGIKLIQILDVDEKNQILITKVWIKHIWKDINLQWNPAKYDNLTTISIPSSLIWVPDVILFNSADGKYEITLMTRANIDYKGNVIWEPPAIYKSSCTINVEYFPFDQQLCTMKFGSWTYDGLQVNLIHMSQTWDENGVLSDDYIPIGMDLQDFYQSHEWDIMSVPAKRSVIMNPNGEEFYPEISFNMTLRRKTLFYTCNLIIPCVGLTFLTVLTFYLPSESGEKISLCISILLSLTVFVLLPNELIPPTSIVVPLIGKYLVFIIIIVTLSITCTVVVLNVHFRSPSTHQMPNWSKRLFLNVLPKFLLMKRPKIISSASTSFLMREYAKSFIEQEEICENYLIKTPTNDCENIGLVNKSKISNLKEFNRENRLFSKNKVLFRSLRDYQIFLDKQEALKAVDIVAENFKRDDKEKRIKQEWKYIALVIDRLLLLIFSTSCIVGTISIILQAPSVYDTKTPIDQLMSKHFNK